MKVSLVFPPPCYLPLSCFTSVFAKEKARERQDYVGVSEISKRTKSSYCLTFRRVFSRLVVSTQPQVYCSSVIVYWARLCHSVWKRKKKKLLLLRAHGGVSVKLTLLFAACYLSKNFFPLNSLMLWAIIVIWRPREGSGDSALWDTTKCITARI